MKKEVAKSLIDKMLKCGALLDEAVATSIEIEDPDEQFRVRLAIADLMGDIHTKVTMKIVTQHPDLNPFPVDPK